MSDAAPPPWVHPDRLNQDPTCLWCDSPATRLCDTMLRRRSLEVIGCTVTRTVTSYPVLDMDTTCSAPLCDECTEELTSIVFCGRDDDGESTAPTTDTLDACRYCQDHIGRSPPHAISYTAEAYRLQVQAHAAASLVWWCS